MVSSKGKPTDPKHREELKDKIKNETNKDGSGKGQWSAWKAIKLAKEYEKDGGGYENEAESKNEPRTGAPEAKPEAKKTQEVDSGPQNGEVAQDDKVEDAREPIEKLKANSGKKPAGKKDTRKAKTAKARKEKKTPTEGIRKSARVGSKRTAPVEDEAAEESEEETVKPKAPAKKARTTKK